MSFFKKKINKNKIKKKKPEYKGNNPFMKFWKFLKKDTWQSWLVSLILAFVLIKWVFFPLLSLSLGTSLPLVVVESCSMYHSTGYDDWWQRNAIWYEREGIKKSDFRDFPFKNGLNKGDIIVVTGYGLKEKGDVIIFNAGQRFPLIHRLVFDDPFGTKGDNNNIQLPIEEVIPEEQILGRAVLKVPALGWLKLVFFEGTKPSQERGFCKEVT